MSTEAVLLDVALIVTFAAGILYWVFVTPERDRKRWRKQLDVGRAAPPERPAAIWHADSEGEPRAR